MLDFRLLPLCSWGCPYSGMLHGVGG